MKDTQGRYFEIVLLLKQRVTQFVSTNEMKKFGFINGFLGQLSRLVSNSISDDMSLFSKH